MRFPLTGILVGILLITLLFTGSAWLFGQQAEKIQSNLFAHANAQPGVSVATTTFQRGLFSSTTTGVASIVQPPLQIDWQQRVFHGPVAWQHIRRQAQQLNLVQAVIDADADITSNQIGTDISLPQPLQLHSFVQLPGQMKGSVTAQAINYRVHDGVSFEASTISSDFDLSPDGRNGSVVARSATLKFADRTGVTQLTQPTLSCELSNGSAVLGLQQCDGDANSVQITDVEGLNLVVKNPELALRVSESEHGVTVLVDMTSPHLMFGASEITSAKTSWRLQDVSKSGLEVLQYELTLHTKLGEPVSTDMLTRWLRLLVGKGQPSVSVQFDAGHNDQPMLIDAQINAPENSLFSNNTLVLLATMDANVKVSLPRVLLDQLPEQLKRRVDVLLARGVIVQDQQTLSIDARYAKGNLLVNGQRHSLLSLVQ